MLLVGRRLAGWLAGKMAGRLPGCPGRRLTACLGEAGWGFSCRALVTIIDVVAAFYGVSSDCVPLFCDWIE